ncbi:MAG: NAD(P)-binding domain-containing protein [Rhodocyclaceae bacterium]|nr:NAD(P)-binding domain-containing protein [Rhodocyclaceae bacterium]
MAGRRARPMGRPVMRSRSRRRLILAALVLSSAHVLTPRGAAADSGLRIGIIGTGRIGGTLAELWAAAGHHLVISSRHPERLEGLARRLGKRVRTGTPADAAAFGEVVLISVPYGALPRIGADLSPQLAGKVVLDTGNPFPGRDGEMAHLARAKGTGAASGEYLPGVRLVRAFTSIPHRALRSEAHRAGERVAVALAADDAEALAVARRLVDDAGFDAVVVGPLAAARKFDVGSVVFGRALTAAELRHALALD